MPEGNQAEHALLQQIDQLRSRMELLRIHLDERSLLDREDAIGELHQSLLELEVAHEELRVQGDELAGVRYQLERERARYHDLFEFAPDAYVVTDDRGVIREVNRAASRMLGVEQRFLPGKPICTYVQEDDVRALRAALNALTDRRASADAPPGEMSLRLRTRDGRTFHAAVAFAGVRGSGGVLVAIRWLLRDVSAQKRHEEEIRRLNDSLELRVLERTAELEQANRTKDRFLAMLSHELRTPLTPVLAASCEMLDHPDLTGEVREGLEMIRRNVELETRLIGDLLDLTRVAHGKLSLDVKVVDVHEVIRAAADICRGDVVVKGQRLELDLSAKDPRVSGDPARLSQVFWNLIRNGVKFTPEGGSITVRTRDAEGGGLTVEISDTGIGIDPDVMARLFNPFEQGDAVFARTYGGLGLGLAISKALVDAHGGRLTVESAGRDRGSRFTVTLPNAPLQPGASGGGAPGAGANGSPEPAALRILLVEDHTDTARVLTKLLSGDGHTVRSAGTVADALALAASEPFDLLISDVGLPDGTGTDLVRRLRDVRPVRGIALTGFGTPEDVSATLDAGFAAHLTKPIEMDKLRHEIRRVTSNLG